MATTRPAFSAIQVRAISERAADPDTTNSFKPIAEAATAALNKAATTPPVKPRRRGWMAIDAGRGPITGTRVQTKPYREPHVNNRIWSVPSPTTYIFPPQDEFEGTTFLAAAVRKAKDFQPPQIPEPLLITPNVETFLLIIGRGTKKYAEKFSTWESFWGASDQELAAAIPNVKERRYVVGWMRRYRNGEYGPAWNLKYIHEGKALLAVYRVPESKGPGSRVVVNVPWGKTGHTIEPHEVHVMGYPYRVKALKQPCGPHARAFKGNKAIIDNWEGLWEFALGEKVDGGERRRKETRFLKAAAARKALREAEGNTF
jgi:hypothetical protein